MSKKLCKAMEFLIEQLLDKEQASTEIHRLSEKSGISTGTLRQAKRLVYVKARKSNDKWYISIPGESREKALSAVQELKIKINKEHTAKSIDIYEISTDWVMITSKNDDSGGWNTVAAPPGVGVARIKVGTYEIEAGSDFPLEKLAGILRGMEGR